MKRESGCRSKQRLHSPSRPVHPPTRYLCDPKGCTSLSVEADVMQTYHSPVRDDIKRYRGISDGCRDRRRGGTSSSPSASAQAPTQAAPPAKTAHTTLLRTCGEPIAGAPHRAASVSQMGASITRTPHSGVAINWAGRGGGACARAYGRCYGFPWFVVREPGHGIGRSCTCGRICAVGDAVSPFLIALYVHLMPPARTGCGARCAMAICDSASLAAGPSAGLPCPGRRRRR